MSHPLDPIDLLRELVGFDTTSANSNLALVDWVANRLDRPGVRVTRQLSADGRKANLVVVLGPEPEASPEPTAGQPTARPRQSGLTLSGHTDVVPANEPGWLGSPFALRATPEGHLIGRGAADMKGFLALAVSLAADLDLSRLRAPLALLFTYDEEIGTLGAQRFASHWDHTGFPLPTACLIGEPTEREVVRLHKGHLKLRVALTGKSGHSGYPHLGANAIAAAGPVIAALRALADTLAEERFPVSDFFPEVPFAAFNFGTIRGGSAINVIAEQTALEIGIRLLPGMCDEDMVIRVEAAVKSALAAAPAGVRAEVSTISSTPPMECAEDAPIHRSLTALIGQTQSRSAMFASDAGPLSSAGFDCVLWGPGSISVAHQPEEWISRAELAAATPVLNALVERFCCATR